MLELKNISFTRNNKKILDNINYIFEDDKFYVITGQNGSGKSTLAKIIMGIEKQDSGQIIYNGIDISNMKYSYSNGNFQGFPGKELCCSKKIYDKK